MRTLGIAVDVKDAAASVHAILVNDSSGSPVIEDQFDVPCDAEDFVAGLQDTARSIRTHVTTLHPDAVVIRRADNPPRPNQSETPRTRLLVEGAITAAARDVCETTFLLKGAVIAGWTQLDKATLDADAKLMLKAAGIQQRYDKALAAAIAGLQHP